MSLCEPVIRFPRVVNDRYQSIAVLPDIEDHVSMIDRISTIEGLPNLHEVPPPCALHDLAPGRNVFRGIRILLR